MPATEKSRIPKNRRLDLSAARSIGNTEFTDAVACVRRSGVDEVIENRLDRRSDARAALSVLGLEVAMAPTCRRGVRCGPTTASIATAKPVWMRTKARGSEN